ncbi:MAG TPA: 16S rRNA (guanine(527)-N(7))-methyltransferase RsmG [Leucothrix mucor]|nr:16S rRNA (guanine(527)-N(7))-methyltransferase RsmG [Leucothrix mucor]
MKALSIDDFWAQGLAALNCKADDEQISKLKQYVDLLHRWNKIYNLTSVRDPRQMIPVHIFDSLAVADYIEGKNCLDVGSGGGLPGIPLAIMQPQRQFTLLDTNGKKTRFMQQAVIELGLKNVNIIQTRVEEHKFDSLFDTIISRAFASVLNYLNTSSRHLAQNGQILAMKGQYPDDELSLLPNEFVIKYAKTLEVPEIAGGRCLINIIRNT